MTGPRLRAAPGRDRDEGMIFFRLRRGIEQRNLIEKPACSRHGEKGKGLDREGRNPPAVTTGRI